MIPIISHGQEGDYGYSYGEFEKHFIEICESHRSEKRALAFAIILRDLRDPQVSKALHDQDYWNALDQISGSYLSVFSFHTLPYEDKPIAERRVFFQMHSVGDKEFHDGRSLIEKYFNLKEQLKLPAVIFFQVSESEIVGTRLVQLKKKTVEESFIEIKEILSCASESVSQVTDENYRNDDVIFQLIDDRLRDRGIKVFLSEIVKKVKSINELLSLF